MHTLCKEYISLGEYYSNLKSAGVYRAPTHADTAWKHTCDHTDVHQHPMKWDDCPHERVEEAEAQRAKEVP